jgi:hypothetical protein
VHRGSAVPRRRAVVAEQSNLVSGAAPGPPYARFQHPRSMFPSCKSVRPAWSKFLWNSDSLCIFPFARAHFDGILISGDISPGVTVCVCVCVCVCLSVCLFVCLSVFLSVLRVWVCASVCVCVRVFLLAIGSLLFWCALVPQWAHCRKTSQARTGKRHEAAQQRRDKGSPAWERKNQPAD